MRVKLDGRPIAITGASSGIGAATARACAARGMPVALGARRVDRLEQLAEQIRATGARAIAVECDVTDDAACERLIERTVDAYGSIYGVFANAGYGFEAPTLETSDESWDAIMDVNVRGSMRVIRPAAELMLDAGEGHILLCSSALSKITFPEYSAYSASKACQDHLGRAMRHELRDRGVAVSTVHPIGTRTEFFDRLATESGRNAEEIEDASGGRRQPVEKVSKAVVRRLASGVGGEVWPSPVTRLGLGLCTAFPWVGDWAVRRKMKRDADAEAESAA